MHVYIPLLCPGAALTAALGQTGGVALYTTGSGAVTHRAPPRQAFVAGEVVAAALCLLWISAFCVSVLSVHGCLLLANKMTSDLLLTEGAFKGLPQASLLLQPLLNAVMVVQVQGLAVHTHHGSTVQVL